jgi:hypothetical protein
MQDRPDFAAATQFLKDIYIDATNTIRHYDNQRTTVATIFVAILSVMSSATGAAVAAATTKDFLRAASGAGTLMTLAMLMIIAKLNSLIRLQRKRASLTMQAWQGLVSQPDLTTINRNARREAHIPLVSSITMGTLWVVIFFLFLIFHAGLSLYLWAR